MRKRVIALAGAAAGIAAGVAAERAAVRKRHRTDPERDEEFGRRRGERSRKITMDDGATIFIEEVGPPARAGVIFIHGSALRTDLWHYQLDGIDGRRCIFFDMRGHGFSQPTGEEEFSVQRMAKDLDAIIADCDLEEVVIVGHSIGGMIALELGSARPDLLGSPIKGIVLTNTTYRPPMETIAGGAAVARFERLARRPLDLIGKQSQRIDYLRRIIRPSDALFWGVSFAAFGPKASAKQIDFTYDMLAETRSDVIFDLLKFYRAFDVRDKLTEITVPVLVIGGAHDRITLPEASRMIADHLPKSELHILEDCGHMAMMERHEEFNQLVEQFCKETLGKVARRKQKVST
ncbi:MAG: alpha/beta hydrolase [Actinomycetota bacterium]|nr:alpha/beta hydrolase [Actinomycetota bacterium]